MWMEPISISPGMDKYYRNTDLTVLLSQIYYSFTTSKIKVCPKLCVTLT